MRKWMYLLAVVILSGAALAQDAPRFQFHGGYAYMRSEGVNFGAGWDIGLSYYFNNYLAVEADISGHYRDNFEFYNFFIGPKLAFWENEDYVPFTHFLVGAGQAQFDLLVGGQTLSTSSAEFAFLIGGGVDIRLTDHIYLRPFQIDYIRQTGDNEADQVRIMVGLSIIGGR
ncbi:MAG: outer membrane beta-barrel protein [Acidobacteria bacterium]|nr:outer membrane beta-barrel protein [Acidobacteriota bacterium]